MTSVFQITDLIGRKTQHSVTFPDEAYTILPGVTVLSDRQSAVTTEAVLTAVTVYGLAVGANRAVYFGPNADGSDLMVGDSGLVHGSSGGFWATSDDVSVVNFGTISGLSGTAVLINGHGARVNNSGTIAGTYGVAFAANELGDRNTLINTGSIQSTPDYETTVERFHAVTFSGTQAVVMNLAGGAITSTSVFGSAVRFASATGLVNDMHGSKLVNHGEIASAGASAVDFSACDAGDRLVLRNFGTITGAVDAFWGGNADDTVINAGTLGGNVIFGAGDDLFDGRGGRVIGGSVYGGDGDDVYYVDDATLDLIEYVGGGAGGSDSVFSSVDYLLPSNIESLNLLTHSDLNGSGNTLDNTINGNEGRNVLHGRWGNDTLRGFGGDDRLFGGLGNDGMFGGEGEDLLRGGVANDTLDGGEDDDILYGGDGRDTLDGGEGDDIIYGGKGRDALTGGDGYDRFVFDHKDSYIDGVLDFVRGEDLIEMPKVRGLFLFTTFIGANPFTGSGAEVRVTQDGVNSIVEMNYEGDTTPEVQVIVYGVLGLTQDDFVL